MNLMGATFEAIGVLAGMAALGWWMAARRIIDTSVARAFNILALDIALPCMIFAGVLERFHPVDMPGWWHLPLWWIGFTAVAGFLSWLAGLLANPAIRREFRASMFYQNAIFLPLAILTQFHGAGAEQVIQLFFFTLFFPPFFFTTFPSFFHHHTGRIAWSQLAHPAMLATLAAIALCLTGTRHLVPEFLVTTMSQVGLMTVPLLMFMIGGRVYIESRNAGPIMMREVILFVVVKNAVFPLIVLLAMPQLMRLTGTAIPPAERAALNTMLLLQAAMPPVISIPAMVEREGGNARFANHLLLASFAAAILTIPLMLWLAAR